MCGNQSKSGVYEARERMGGGGCSPWNAIRDETSGRGKGITGWRREAVTGRVDEWRPIDARRPRSTQEDESGLFTGTVEHDERRNERKGKVFSEQGLRGADGRGPIRSVA